MTGGVAGQGLCPEQAFLGPAGSVWVLDFMQERFYYTRPDDVKTMFIKAGTLKKKREGLEKEEASGDSPSWPALSL